MSAKIKKKSVQLVNPSPDLLQSKRYSQQIYGVKKMQSADQQKIVNTSKTPKYKVLTKMYQNDNVYNTSVSVRQKSISQSSQGQSNQVSSRKIKDRSLSKSEVSESDNYQTQMLLIRNSKMAAAKALTFGGQSTPVSEKA
jgi:hypothetical protein